MQRKLRRILVLFFFLVSFFGLRFAAAIACVLLPLPTVLDEYKWADVVITARMVSIEKTKEPDPAHFDIRSATMVVQPHWWNQLSFAAWGKEVDRGSDEFKLLVCSSSRFT